MIVTFPFYSQMILLSKYLKTWTNSEIEKGTQLTTQYYEVQHKENNFLTGIFWKYLNIKNVWEILPIPLDGR